MYDALHTYALNVRIANTDKIYIKLKFNPIKID